MIELKDLFGAAGAVAAGQDIRKRLEKVGTEAQQQALAIGREAQTGTAFKPFTVSTGFGGLGTTAGGGTTTTLSPELAAQQQALQGISGGLTGSFQQMGPQALQALTDPTGISQGCLLYTSPSPRDLSTSRMPSSA